MYLSRPVRSVREIIWHNVSQPFKHVGLHVIACCAPARRKDVVKDGLEAAGLPQRPQRVLLVAKNDVIEDRLGYAQVADHLVVNVGAACRQRDDL